MAGITLRGPLWFFGWDTVFEGIAFSVLLIIALYSYRAFRLTRDRMYFFLSGSFFLLSLAFLSRVITNSVMYWRYFSNIGIKNGVDMSVPDLFLAGYAINIVLSVAALVVLIMVTRRRLDYGMMILLFATMLPSVIMARSHYLSFHVLAGLLLLFVVLHLFWRLKSSLAATSLSVWVAFLLLAIAQLQFVVEDFSKVFYVSGHITQLGGYILLLLALIAIVRKR